MGFGHFSTPKNYELYLNVPKELKRLEHQTSDVIGASEELRQTFNLDFK